MKDDGQEQHHNTEQHLPNTVRVLEAETTDAGEPHCKQQVRINAVWLAE